jgi:hypothetical protein
MFSINHEIAQYSNNIHFFKYMPGANALPALRACISVHVPYALAWQLTLSDTSPYFNVLFVFAQAVCLLGRPCMMDMISGLLTTKKLVLK